MHRKYLLVVTANHFSALAAKEKEMGFLSIDAHLAKSSKKKKKKKKTDGKTSRKLKLAN